ncbi:MAG: hypothetical protein U0903_15265 [Planctomycetales bacterium]
MPQEFLIENSGLGKEGTADEPESSCWRSGRGVGFLGNYGVFDSGSGGGSGKIPLISYMAGFLAATNLVMAVIPEL